MAVQVIAMEQTGSCNGSERVHSDHIVVKPQGEFVSGILPTLPVECSLLT